MCVQHGGQAIGAQTHLGTERGRSPADWRGETNVVAQLAATGGALAGQVWGLDSLRLTCFDINETIATRLEAIATRLEAIAIRLEAIACRLEAIA